VSDGWEEADDHMDLDEDDVSEIEVAVPTVWEGSYHLCEWGECIDQIEQMRATVGSIVVATCRRSGLPRLGM